MKRLTLLLTLCLTCLCGICPLLQAQGFALPAVPDSLTTPAARANYLSLHYWQHYRFTSTDADAPADADAEQAFADFLSVLPHCTVAHEAFAQFFRLLAEASVNQQSAFLRRVDKYLYDLDSPFCSDSLHRLALQAALTEPHLAPVHREQLRYRLQLVLKNLPGSVATDFSYADAAGKSCSLHRIRAPYILLFFYDADCTHCRITQLRLAASSAFAEQVEQGRVVVLAVEVSGRTPEQGASLPAGWTAAFDTRSLITGRALYDLKQMPTLYLLDARKRVLLKDATPEQLIRFEFISL